MSKTSELGRKAARGAPINREARILLVLGLPILVVTILIVMLYNNNQNTETANVDNSLLIKADSPTLGPADAPVTLVEFLDPECESCRAAFPFVKQLLQQYEGRLRLVVRYFPLHNNSLLAVVATEAAGEQGKYWEMQELLFTNQTEWGEQSVPQTELFISYAEQLGLDTQAFASALQNPAYSAKAQRDQQDGTALGVDSTPTFFINGQLVEELSSTAIVAMIERELAQ